MLGPYIQQKICKVLLLGSQHLWMQYDPGLGESESWGTYVIDGSCGVGAASEPRIHESLRTSSFGHQGATSGTPQQWF